MAEVAWRGRGDPTPGDPSHRRACLNVSKAMDAPDVSILSLPQPLCEGILLLLPLRDCAVCLCASKQFKDIAKVVLAL